MMIPTVHRNGTGGTALLDQVTNAASAIHDALRAMCDAAPNARDYYVQGEQAFKRAAAEHSERCAIVRKVGEKYMLLADHIDEQLS
jgi:hypothetical protein